MTASMLTNADDLQKVSLVICICALVLAVSRLLSDDEPGPWLLILVLALGVMFTVHLDVLMSIAYFVIGSDVVGGEDSGSSLHTSANTTKYIVMVVIGLLLVVLAVYVFYKYKTWYNSPAQVEARALREDEALQRIEQGLADNPDYQSLLAWNKDLTGRQSPVAQRHLVEVKAKLAEIKAQEEAAALAYIADGLEEIRFRNDPAKPGESADT